MAAPIRGRIRLPPEAPMIARSSPPQSACTLQAKEMNIPRARGSQQHGRSRMQHEERFEASRRFETTWMESAPARMDASTMGAPLRILSTLEDTIEDGGHDNTNKEYRLLLKKQASSPDTGCPTAGAE
eukprot:c34802_g1_i1 orf=115-498(-)